MRYSLPILTGIGWSCAVAALLGTGNAARGQTGQSVPPASAAPAAVPADGTKLLADVIRAVESRRSIAAETRLRVDLFGKQLVGKGSYAELRDGPVPLVRYDLSIQVGDQATTVLQVCDGRYLWKYQKLSEKEEVGRIDALRALAALEQQPPSARVSPGLGGLSRLLRGLDRAFLFGPPQAGKVGELAVLRLEGAWRPGMLMKMLPKQNAAIEQGEPADLGKLPEHVPQAVVLLVGSEDLFPYQIEYSRLRAEGDAEPERSSLVGMDFFNVVLDGPLDRRQFAYNPGAVEVNEQTESFLQGVGK